MIESPEYIYAIQAGGGGPIKIGRTFNPRSRLQELQIGNPATLTLLTEFRGDRAKEKEIHAELRHHRIRGEWFRPTPKVLAVIDREFVLADQEHPVAYDESRVRPWAKCDICTGPLDTDEYGEHVHLRGICGACEEFQDLRESGEDPFAYLDKEAA